MLLIDDQGRLWDRPSLKLQLGLNDPSLELDGHVIGMGFIALETRPASLHVRLNPAIASPVALAALFHKLADDRPARVVVSCVGERKADELCGSWRSATDRISRLVFNAHQSASRAFLGRRMPVERVLGSPLGKLLNRWREAERVYNRSAFEEILSRELAGRHLIAEGHSERRSITLLSVGDGFLSHNEHWRRHAVGRSMESHPDYYYGKWAASLYRDALGEDGPRVDDIDVMVKRVGDTARRVRYRRLILPFRFDARTTWLLGASMVDPTIDLRAEC